MWLPRGMAVDAENSAGSQKPTNTSSSLPERVLVIKTHTWKLMATELLGCTQHLRRPKCFNEQHAHPSTCGDSWLVVRLTLK